MISYWIYWSSFCFWQSIPFSIGYNCLYRLGYLLMQFPVCYSCIVSGMLMPFGYPWCHRVIGWVSFYSTWLHLPFGYSPGFILLRLFVSQPDQSFLVIGLENTVAVLSCWKLTYSVPAHGDSSLLPLSLSSPNMPSSSVLTSLWLHLSVSIISSKTILFCLSSASLLTSLGGSISVSLHMVSLRFPCSVCSSGLSFSKNVFLLVC